MALTLSQLKRFSSAKKKRKRIGRGNSGKGGTYAGRGQKGQRSRSGGKRRAGHQGKRSPAFIRQIPKNRGFQSIQLKMNIVNLDQLDNKFGEGENVNPKKLLSKGIISNIYPGVKILGGGKISKKLNVSANRFSKSAEDAIKKAGGTVKFLQVTNFRGKEKNQKTKGEQERK